MELIPSKRVQDLKEVIDIMYKTSVEIINTKKEAMKSADPAVAAEMRTKKDIISIISTFRGPMFNRLTGFLTGS